MNKSWFPYVIGLLLLLVASIRFLVGVYILFSVLFNYKIPDFLVFGVPGFNLMPVSFIIGMAIFMILASIFLVFCGVLSLKKRGWGLIIAGSLFTIVMSPLIGFATLVVTLISKKQFSP